MGLYNFKPQFIPKILAGDKTHTIRARRADGWVEKAGNTVHLYTGNRTKKSRLLMRAICTKVQSIEISQHWTVEIDGESLSADEREQLARRDGFANFADMMQFWEGRLPFEGYIIHWRDGVKA